MVSGDMMLNTFGTWFVCISILLALIMILRAIGSG